MRTRRLDREEEATLVEHLEELRGRIMVTLAAVGVASAVAFVFHGAILDLLDHVSMPSPARAEAPVFGCHLFDPSAPCAAGSLPCKS